MMCMFMEALGNLPEEHLAKARVELLKRKRFQSGVHRWLPISFHQTILVPLYQGVPWELHTHTHTHKRERERERDGHD